MEQNVNKIQTILQAIDKTASQSTGKISKMYSGVKDFMTGNYDEKISWVLNLFIYFIALTGLLNIIYYQFFDEMQPLVYGLLCILVPIIVTTTVKSSGFISHFFQKIFFNEREIAIIVVGGVITLLISMSI